MERTILSEKADLHMHSKFSLDGELEVEEILKVCKHSGMNTISITDHNSVKGVPAAVESGPSYGMTVIPGIEIDCNYKGTDLHVLGYNIDPQSRDFAILEDQIAGRVMDSFSAMVENLSRAGIDVDAGEVLHRAKGGLPSGELIAEVLLSNSKYRGIERLNPYRPGGERSDMPYINFYLDYFAQGKSAYVKIEYMDFPEAVALIKANKGVPVVAHPGLNLKGREDIVEELLDQGASGVEVFNNYHDYDQMAFFAGVVQKRNALMTCGSDFHGKTKPLIKPGIFRKIREYEGYVAASIERLRIR